MERAWTLKLKGHITRVRLGEVGLAGVGSSPSRTLPSFPVASSYEGSEAGEGIGVRRDVQNGHGYAGGPNAVEKP